MVITTCYRPTEKQRKRCEEIKNVLYGEIAARDKQSVAAMIERYGKNVLVVSDNSLTYYIKEQAHSVFFHPGSAILRVKRRVKGGYDPFIEATGLCAGMSVLDCTLGMGIDAIFSAFVVGSSGKVVGLEKSPLLAYLTADGLKHFQYDLNLELQAAMRSIEVYAADHVGFLEKTADRTYDIVYFDPMFQKPIEASKGIEGLRQICSYDKLSEYAVEQAKRVAKKRVILKAHYESPLFEKYGFQVLRRKTAKFHYGVIEVSDG